MHFLNVGLTSEKERGENEGDTSEEAEAEVEEPWKEVSVVEMIESIPEE